jgi:Holliday junction DNA helicase RuvA
MLARITGTLERIEGTRATVALDGFPMAVEAHMPAFLAERLLASLGAPVTLHTLLQMEPHGQSGALTPRLLAFATADDRRFFELFTTVKGLGGKRALRAMAEPPATIAGAIARRDLVALQRLPEIGKRLAETIVAELHGKVDAFALEVVGGAARIEPKTGDGASAQAIEALIRLGEPRAEAERKVGRAMERNPALDSPEAILAASLAG